MHFNKTRLLTTFMFVEDLIPGCVKRGAAQMTLMLKLTSVSCIKSLLSTDIEQDISNKLDRTGLDCCLFVVKD